MQNLPALPESPVALRRMILNGCKDIPAGVHRDALLKLPDLRGAFGIQDVLFMAGDIPMPTESELRDTLVTAGRCIIASNLFEGGHVDSFAQAKLIAGLPAA